MEQTEKDDDRRAGIVTNVVEAVVAFVLAALGAVVVYASVQLGAKWTSDGPGSGYFPFYVGLLLCLSGAGTLYQALLGKGRNTDDFVDREQLKMVLAVLIPAAIYVVVVQLLGIYLASTLYIALFMVVLGKYSWVKSVFAALAVDAVFFLMFEVWFKVPLYKGIYDPLSFLGY